MKFLAALIAAIAIPAIFVAGDSSAASSSLTVNNQTPNSDIVIYQGSGASAGTPILDFQPNYVVIKQQWSDFQNFSSCGSNRYGLLSLAQGSGYNIAPLACVHYFNPTISIDLTSYWTTSNNNVLLVKPEQFLSMMTSLSDSIEYTFYDSVPSSDCPDCPEVPDLPYGEKLDHLTAAIIFVPATMLVIYFMFAIYSMFFRGLK